MTNEALGLLKKLSPVELHQLLVMWKEKKLTWAMEEELVRLQELQRTLKVSA